MRARWLKKPTKEKITIDKIAIKNLFIQWSAKINAVLAQPSVEMIKLMIEEIYKMRTAGLEAEGEYSKENLVFKLLRNTKLLDKLKDLEVSLYDKTVSINEGISDEIKIEREEFDRGVRFVAMKDEQRLGKISLNKEFVTGYYTIVAFQVFDKSLRYQGIGKKLMNAVLTDREITQKPILVQPYP